MADSQPSIWCRYFKGDTPYSRNGFCDTWNHLVSCIRHLKAKNGVKIESLTAGTPTIKLDLQTGDGIKITETDEKSKIEANLAAGQGIEFERNNGEIKIKSTASAQNIVAGTNITITTSGDTKTISAPGMIKTINVNSASDSNVVATTSIVGTTCNITLGVYYI